MSQFAKLTPFATLGLLLLITAGCSKYPVMDAKTIAMHRTRLALVEEPDGVQTVADVRSTLLGNGELDHEDHDHDGDGHQDHEAAGHDEDGDDHAGHDHKVHAHATEAQEVAVVGHIGGLANPWADTQPDYPFAKTQAVFFLADPQAVVDNEESGHSHAPGEECPFCAAHAADKADMLAVVQFVDEKGAVLQTDVRELFDVKEKDTVVVRGKARVTEGGILVVDAHGLYIRK